MDSASPPASPPPPPPTAGARIAAALHARSRAVIDDLAVSKRARNVTGFIFIIAGLLSSIAAATIDGDAADLTGRFGIWSAHLLFALFGKAAYLFGPALIWSGLRGIARDDWQAYLSGVIGNLSLLWSLAVFFHLSGGTEPGIAGEQFGLLLEFFTGRTGAYTINALLLFTGLLLLLQIPFDQVKERVIDMLEGRSHTPDSDSSVWLKRAVALVPLIPMAYSLYSKFRKSRKEQTANAQSEAKQSSTQETPFSGESVYGEQNQHSAEPVGKQATSGGTPVLKRFRSEDRPPWIQKVVVSDDGLETGSDLEEMTEEAIREAESLSGRPHEGLEHAGMEQDRPFEDRYTQIRRAGGNRWRPGHGFDSTEDDEYNPFPDESGEDESSFSNEGSLIIEEDRFPLSSGRNDFRNDLPPSHSRSGRHNPRIVFDPVKNRYLFRQSAEEQALAPTRQRVELLDRMDLDLPHAYKGSFAGEKEAFDNGNGLVATDDVAADSYADGFVDNAGEGSQDDLLQNFDERFEPDSVDNLDETFGDAYSYAGPEETEDLDEEADDFTDEEPAMSAPSVAEANAPKKKADQPLLPNINMPPVVFSENRFSRYRLSRRIVKQTPKVEAEDPEAEIRENWQRLEKVMSDYGIQAKVVGAIRGPMITMFEVLPEPGVRVNRILGIQDEIRMHLAAISVRILAPIPGKSTIGVELPNRNRQYVSMGDLANGDPEFASGKRELSIALGKDITGTNRYLDLTRLPHLLIAGATGSGKSVFMNSVIGSLLFNHSPDEVRFLMVDPKMVELKLFEGIPHLLYPVITDVRLADRALNWAVQEMESRYQLLSSAKCRDIRSYNERVKSGALSGKLMPYIVILIDELSDLMMVSAKEVEDSIIRLTQKARAVGIHVIMATQRPSVDVITALIKANCPARISFQVAQRTDSRVILDANGAEALLGRGDMLYKSPTAADPARMQSPMISDEEIEQLVTEACRYGHPRFIELPGRESDDGGGDDGGADVDQALLDSAWEIIQESGKTSTSYVQRRLRIGYNRAATIVEKLEQMGYLGPAIGNRPREILKRH